MVADGGLVARRTSAHAKNGASRDGVRMQGGAQTACAAGTFGGFMRRF